MAPKRNKHIFLRRYPQRKRVPSSKYNKLHVADSTNSEKQLANLINSEKPHLEHDKLSTRAQSIVSQALGKIDRSKEQHDKSESVPKFENNAWLELLKNRDKTLHQAQVLMLWEKTFTIRDEIYNKSGTPAYKIFSDLKYLKFHYADQLV